MATPYDSSFYDSQKDGSAQSARQVAPLLLDLVRPNSILDVGCGVGTWLSVFEKEHGVQDVLGLDGDYVKPEMLRIPSESFRATDLSKPFDTGRTFDLAISLEVGEHLPPQSADSFIHSITAASPVVLFSAAIPGQIGTHHVNEQFPEYWAEKFKARGYLAIDYLRKTLWRVADVEWWYKQNMLLYIREDVYAARFSKQLKPYLDATDPDFLTRIHPDMLTYYVGKYQQLSSFEGFLRYKLYPIKKALR